MNHKHNAELFNHLERNFIYSLIVRAELVGV